MSIIGLQPTALAAIYEAPRLKPNRSADRLI
jgi:hypothetical protein